MKVINYIIKILGKLVLILLLMFAILFLILLVYCVFDGVSTVFF